MVFTPIPGIIVIKVWAVEGTGTRDLSSNMTTTLTTEPRPSAEPWLRVQSQSVDRSVA
jgi:hypothetical protein